MPTPASKTKSPINLLVGRALRLDREDRRMSDLVLANAIGLTDSYVRGIEAGTFKCPADKTHLVCEALGWNYQAAAALLTAATVLDSTRKEDDSVAARLAKLSTLAPDFEYVWAWCKSSTQGPGSRLLTQRVNTWRRSIHNSPEVLDFDAVVSALRSDLKKGPRLDQGPAALGFSPFFLPAVEGFTSALKVLQATLNHAAPVVNVEGLRHFGVLHSGRIRGVEAFLGYEPKPAEFRDDTLYWGWLLNKTNPMISLYLAEKPRALQGNLNEALKVRFKGQKLTRDCVEIHKCDIPLDGGFHFDVASRIVSIGTRSSADDLPFNNAWIYRLQSDGPDVYLAMLDNYKEGRSKIYGASLDALESAKLRARLLGE